jgi:hypothetical protein
MISELEASAKDVHLNKDPLLSGAKKIPLGNRTRNQLFSELEKTQKSTSKISLETLINTRNDLAIKPLKQVAMNKLNLNSPERIKSANEQKRTFSGESLDDELDSAKKRNKVENAIQVLNNHSRKQWKQMDALRKRHETLELQEKEKKIWSSLEGEFLLALATGNSSSILLELERLPDEALTKILAKMETGVTSSIRAKVETKFNLLKQIFMRLATDSEKNAALTLLGTIEDLTKQLNLHLPTKGIREQIVSEENYHNVSPPYY